MQGTSGVCGSCSDALNIICPMAMDMRYMGILNIAKTRDSLRTRSSSTKRSSDEQQDD